MKKLKTKKSGKAQKHFRVIKLLVTMKLIFVFVCGIGLMAGMGSTYGQTTKFTFDYRDITIKQVLLEIENNSKYAFMYNNKEVDVNRKVDIKVEDAEIFEVLDELFGANEMDYKAISRYIIIKPVNSSWSPNLIGGQLYQTSTVTGKVTDSSGQPLPGVSIVVKGTTQGTVTDSDGEYTITNLPDNTTLVFSFVGMQTQEVIVGNQTKINVTMEEEVIGIEDVVVTAYSRTLKSTLTSSITALKGEKLVDVPVSTITNSLAGRVAGILSYQTSGEPGFDASTIRIRGRSTTGNSAPLVVIDGIPGDMTGLNPRDIEDMSVLKDAAAVAPYGLAGANGVILITTKRGKKERVSFSYNAHYGIQNPVHLTETINSYQMALMYNEIYRNDHPDDPNIPYTDEKLEEYRKVCEGDPNGNYDKYFNSKNLHDVIRNDYPISNQNFSVTGGSETIKYFGSLRYFTQASMIPNENFKRYNGLLNLDADLTETFKFWASVRIENNFREWPSFGEQITKTFGLYGRCYEIAPDDPIWYPNTDGFWAKGRFDFNPIGRVKTSGMRTNKVNNSLYTLGLDKQLPLKGLSVKGVFYYGYDSEFGENWNKDPIYWDVDNTVDPALYIKREPESKPSFGQSYSRRENLSGQGFINYDNTFGKHNVNGLFVAEIRDIKYKFFTAERKNYSIPIHVLDMGSSVSTDIGNSGNASNARQIGYVLKLSYNYDSKYLFDLSGRYDGHYYFAPGRRFGLFPAISLGWRIGQEKFIKNNYSWINEIKLRASWGQTGNLAGRPFQYMSTMGIQNEAYRIGGKLQTGLYEQSPPNPNITWEKQEQTNIGIDLNLWNDLLSLKADYFYQYRYNMLLEPNVILPGEYGIGLPQENAGKMSNHGIEITAGTRHNFANGITFDVNANFSFARNKYIEIFENKATYDDPNRRRTGRQMESKFGLVSLGYFQSEEEIENSPPQKFGYYTVGDVKYADINGDGVVDATDEKWIGYPNYPEAIFGLDIVTSWKNFDARILIQGATLVNVFRPGAAGGGSPGRSNGNTQVEGLDRWTPENPNAKFPRWSHLSFDNNFRFSTHYMRDGSYIRLKDFNIGYTLPDELVSKISINSLRLYVSGQNMFTWTAEYLNADPESAAGGSYRFANQKAVSIGINLTF